MEDLYNSLLKYFINATITVWNSFIKTPMGKPYVEKAEENVFLFSGYVGVMSFAPALSGRIIIAMDDPVALKVRDAFLDDEVEDSKVDTTLFSVAEFTNIVGGNTFSVFNNNFEKYRISPSPPSAFYGKNIKFINFKVKGFNVIFPIEDKKLVLNMVILGDKND